MGTLRAERRAFMQCQKASTEIERRARVLRTYQWIDHRAKVARTEAQIVDQARGEKERATHEDGVAEKDRVDVQTQRDRELKKGGKVTQIKQKREPRNLRSRD